MHWWPLFLALIPILYKIKDFILLIKSLIIWLQLRMADRKLTKSTLNYIQELNKELNGSMKSLEISFINKPDQIESKVKFIGDKYSIVSKLPEKFNWRYLHTWQELETNLLIKMIESGSFLEIKEILPLDISIALDLYLSYKAAILKENLFMARLIRENLDEIVTIHSLTNVKDWFLKIEELNTFGSCFCGLCLPVLLNVYKNEKMKISTSLRNDCKDFIEWLLNWSRQSTRIEIEPFECSSFSCYLVPIFSQDWSFYTQQAINHADCMFIIFCSSERWKMKAIEAAIGTKKLAPKFEFGISRFFITRGRTRDTILKRKTIGYLNVEITTKFASVEEKRNQELNVKKSQFIKRNIHVVVGIDKNRAINNIRNLLKLYGEITVENDKNSWENMIDIILESTEKHKCRIAGWGFYDEEWPRALFLLEKI